MSTEAPLLKDGSQTVAASNLYNPGSALAGPNGSGQFLAVRLTASRTVDIMSAATQIPYGILQNTPTAGAPADVALTGISKAVAGAALSTAGVPVMADSSGRVVAWTAGSVNYIIGYLVETAAAINDIVAIQVDIGQGAS